MKKIILPFVLGAGLIAPCVYGQPSTNLLVNANGEAGNMTGWTVTANGGSGWYVGDGFGSALSGATHPFCTSYGWDIRSQTVDLLAIGYTAAQLDSAPQISITDWVRPYIGNGEYFINVLLENASHDVIDTWSDGSQSSPQVIAEGQPWTEISTTLEYYGSGLRYIVFEDGGKDTKGWGGNYGTAFDGSSVTLDISSVPEPSIFALTGLGGAGLLLFRRRK
jgi:hypothetical protein